MLSLPCEYHNNKTFEWYQTKNIHKPFKHKCNNNTRSQDTFAIEQSIAPPTFYHQTIRQCANTPVTQQPTVHGLAAQGSIRCKHRNIQQQQKFDFHFQFDFGGSSFKPGREAPLEPLLRSDFQVLSQIPLSSPLGLGSGG